MYFFPVALVRGRPLPRLRHRGLLRPVRRSGRRVLFEPDDLRRGARGAGRGQLLRPRRPAPLLHRLGGLRLPQAAGPLFETAGTTTMVSQKICSQKSFRKKYYGDTFAFKICSLQSKRLGKS